MPGTPPIRILSIQSHVVYGYVGNKCAVAPLNRFGYEVDAINSVQFSNHTGYPSFNGQVLDGNDLMTIIDGLEQNKLLASYTHLLTGYIGSLSLLQSIARVVERLRAHNPNLVYVCDPVQGDDGRLYCKPEVPEAFRASIIPLASVITPNQFEAELLSGIKIQTEEDAVQACNVLHTKGPHTVVISSLDISKRWVTIIASTKRKSPMQIKLRVPRVEAYFTGTGDLFSSLLLAWMVRCPDDLQVAVEAAVGGLQHVLADTIKHSGGGVSGTDARDARVCSQRELRIIQNLDALPSLYDCVTYKAIPVDQPW